LTQAAISQLRAHDWPGNVRELQNVVERAIILSRGGPLRFELAGPAPAAALPRPSLGESGVLTRDELKRRERDSLSAALALSAGKIFGPDGAAELLGMKPTTLASRIKALGLTKKTTRR
jgi:DNA-binding NtrC family response regulator